MYKEFIKLNSKRHQEIQLKNGQRNQIDIFQRRLSNGQKVHEEMLSVTYYQGNINQNHDEIPPPSC